MNPPNRTLRDISRTNRRRTLPSANVNANPSHPNERRNSLPTANTDPVDPARTDEFQTSPHIFEETARLTRLYNEQVRICLQLRLDYNDILADKELAEQNQVDAEEQVEQVKDDMRKMKEEHEDEVQELRDEIEKLESKQKEDEDNYSELQGKLEAEKEENDLLKQVIDELERLVRENYVRRTE